MRRIVVGLGIALAVLIGPPAQAAVFGPPSTIARGVQDPPAVTAVDAAGTIAAAWAENEGACSARHCAAVRVLVRAPGGRAARTFALGHVGVTQIAGLFVDPRGVATVVYLQDGRGVRVARCSVRGCGSARPLDVHADLAAAGMDAAGRVLVLWRHVSAHRATLRWSAAGARGRFAVARSLRESGQSLAVAGTGARLLAAWAVPGAVRGAVLGRGGRLGRPRTLAAERSARAPSTDLHLAGTGRGWLAAWRTSAPAADVATADVALDGRAATAVPRGDLGPGPLALAAAPSGRAVLAAGDCGAGAPGVVVAMRAHRRGAFGPAGTLAGSAGGCPAAVAMDDGARAAIGWIAGGVPLVATGEPGGTTGEAQLDPGGCDQAARTCSAPLLAAAGGRTVAVWTGPDGLRAATRLARPIRPS